MYNCTYLPVYCVYVTGLDSALYLAPLFLRKYQIVSHRFHRETVIIYQQSQISPYLFYANVLVLSQIKRNQSDSIQVDSYTVSRNAPK